MATAPLIERIEAFLSQTGMMPTVFGKAALNDPTFVFKLRKGRRVWPETAERVEDFMRQRKNGRAA